MIDTFSGIGGFSLAARWLGGIETVQFVEREPYCRHILAKHWPDVPIHDDICTFNPAPGSADIVCGGFPCQDISTAGKQAGIKEGTRSGLFYELMRVVRVVRPRYVVLENVAAITSNGLDTVLGTLAEAGFDAEWACIPAADVGACHRRDRWWCVAHATHLLGNGSTARHGGQSGGRAVSESGDCGGAGDAADAERRGGEAERQRGQLEAAAAGARSDWAGSADTAGRGGEAAPNPHHQRQQERQPAAIASGTEWTGWGNAPRRLNPDWRSYLSQPVLCRGDDGLSGRVDRLKALGNAVVPQVAMVPLARVIELAA
jgi:DNA (cytosine-5)-methyltransferase 1